MSFKYTQSLQDLIQQGLLEEKNRFAKSAPKDSQGQLYLVNEVDSGLESLWDLKEVYPEIQEEIEKIREETKELANQIKKRRDDIRDARKEAQPDWRKKVENLEKAIKNLEKRSKSAGERITRMKSEFEKELKDVKHQVILKLPEGYAPPAKMPKRFEAAFLVREVCWDEEAPLPYFVIYADLVKSEDLGLSAGGIIPDTKNQDE